MFEALFIGARVDMKHFNPVNEMMSRELISIVPVVVANCSAECIFLKWKTQQIKQDPAIKAAKRLHSHAQLKRFHPTGLELTGVTLLMTRRNFYKGNTGWVGQPNQPGKPSSP